MLMVCGLKPLTTRMNVPRQKFGLQRDRQRSQQHQRQNSQNLKNKLVIWNAE